MSGVSTPSPKLSSTIDLDRAAQSTKGALVQLRPDLRARSPRQQPHALARVAQRQHEEARPLVLAGARIAHHRPVAAVIDLAFLAWRGGDHDARLGGRRAAQLHDEAADARILGGEAVIVDEVLVDRDGVATATQGRRDQLAIGFTGARARRPRRPGVGGHLRWRNCGICPGVGGHLRRNCGICRPFARPSAAAHRQASRPQVPRDRGAIDAHGRRQCD